jgi:hypothetical protein
VMYATQGIGGLIADHARYWHRGSLRCLVGPYLLGLLAAMTLSGGTVFLFEYLSRLFSDPYGIQSAATKALPVVELFGVTWRHTSLTTWLVPVAAFAIGILLLRSAIRRIGAAWEEMKTTSFGAGE